MSKTSPVVILLCNTPDLRIRWTWKEMFKRAWKSLLQAKVTVVKVHGVPTVSYSETLCHFCWLKSAVCECSSRKAYKLTMHCASSLRNSSVGLSLHRPSPQADLKSRSSANLTSQRGGVGTMLLPWALQEVSSEVKVLVKCFGLHGKQIHFSP